MSRQGNDGHVADDLQIEPNMESVEELLEGFGLDLVFALGDLLGWSRNGDLNPGLAVYETATLPLSYSGIYEVSK